MIFCYLVIAVIVAIMLLIEAHESELDFFETGLTSILTYISIFVLSMMWPMVLAISLYDTWNDYTNKDLDTQ